MSLYDQIISTYSLLIDQSNCIQFMFNSCSFHTHSFLTLTLLVVPHTIFSIATYSHLLLHFFCHLQPLLPYNKMPIITYKLVHGQGQVTCRISIPPRDIIIPWDGMKHCYLMELKRCVFSVETFVLWNSIHYTTRFRWPQSCWPPVRPWLFPGNDPSYCKGWKLNDCDLFILLFSSCCLYIFDLGALVLILL